MANKRIHELTGDSTPDADAYLVLDKASYAAPVKATVTELLQGLPVALQTAGGNARGAGAVDLQIIRSDVSQVASGAYATITGGLYNTTSGNGSGVVCGQNNVVSGVVSVIGGGYANQVTANYAGILTGYGALANKGGQIAQAYGLFAAVGDAQHSVFVVRNGTADETPTTLLLNTVDYLTIADDTVWNFRAEIVGMTADAAAYAAYTVRGLVRRANGTVTVHGVTTETITESDAAWDATAVADDTNKALSIIVTGAAGTQIRWHAAIHTSEITYA